MKAGLILLDCPWHYAMRCKGAAHNHYETMSLERLLSLPIKDVVAEDAVMLCWCTNPHLEQGLRFIKQHGFQYRTKVEWVKMHRADLVLMGTGYHARGATEPLLIATRGRPRIPAPSDREAGVIIAEDTLSDETADNWEEQDGLLVHPKNAQKHSAKPEKQYDIGEKYAGPYLSVFDRRYREGWTCIGDDLDGLDIEDSLRLYAEANEMEDGPSVKLPQVSLLQSQLYVPDYAQPALCLTE